MSTTSRGFSPPTKAAPLPDAVSFKDFLERVPPSKEKLVSSVWIHSRDPGNPQRISLNTPDLVLDCRTCKGERIFRSDERIYFRGTDTYQRFLVFTCGNCNQQKKSYSVIIAMLKAETFLDSGFGYAKVYKYGEQPSFGSPVPDDVLDLFGADRHIFLKGRQCENQGLGIGAFAYYRRVVERHKDNIFDAIIAAATTLNPDPALIEKLTKAKESVSFRQAMDDIKPAVPQGLMVNGHNPLVLLHQALSHGLHKATDTKCLEDATAARLILTELAKRMAILKQDNSEIESAAQRLIKSSSGGTREDDPDLDE